MSDWEFSVEQVCSTDANDELGNGVLFFWLGCLISVGIYECFLEKPNSSSSDISIY